MRKYSIFMLSIFILFSSGCSSEYDRKLVEVRSLYENEKYAEASELMDELEIKKEDMSFSIDVLQKNLESLEAIQNGLIVVDKKMEKNSNYIYVTGAVKNEGETVYNYVKVKVTYYDKDKQVVDTDWTYAVSSEKLKPNEQKYFEVATKYKENIVNAKVEIEDYNYE